MLSTVNKDELIALGFKPNQAKMILRQARLIMVEKGKNYWANPRLSVAPRYIVEEVILGISLDDKENADDSN